MITTTTINKPVDKNSLKSTPSHSTRERILASTMSVDEYFDELIAQVHEDYATLCPSYGVS